LAFDCFLTTDVDMSVKVAWTSSMWSKTLHDLLTVPYTAKKPPKCNINYKNV